MDLHLHFHNLPDAERVFMALAGLCGSGQGVEHLTPDSGVVVPREAVGVSKPIDDAIAGWRDEMSARGCRPKSIDRMVSIVERVAECSGWSAASHVNYSSAVAFLAARRRQDKPWSGPTYDQAVSTLRTFGEFLRRSGHTQTNPLVDLQSCGEKGEDGARALTADEARALIAASIDRHLRSRRAKGCAPLFWLFMFYTGLRYAEAENVKWKDVDLSTSTMCTDPKCPGNKARRRDRIPLHPVLADLLRGHVDTVHSAPSSPIFPKAPTRHTWHLERAAAGIPERDARNRPVTTHSCRKSFCTWFDSQSIPRGLVSRLARHAETLTEDRYIDHAAGREVEAIAALPQLWPCGLQLFSIKARKISCISPGSGEDGAVTPSTDPMCYIPTQLDQTSGPVSHIGSGVTTRPQRSGAADPVELNESRSSVSPSPLSARVISIKRDNGQGRTETGCALNPTHQNVVPPDERVALVLAGWLERRTGGTPR